MNEFSQEQSYRCATFILKIRADFVKTSALFLLNPIKVTLTRTTLESTTVRKLRDRENRLVSSLKRFLPHLAREYYSSH